MVQQVEAEAEDQPLSRLRTASALVNELAEIGDAVLGYFVDEARHAGHSWSEIGEALGRFQTGCGPKTRPARVSLGLNNPIFERLRCEHGP